jgi:TonB family protein
MDSLEIQLRRCTRSFTAWGGAAIATTVLFVGIAATSITSERMELPMLPPLSLAPAPGSSLPTERPPAPRQLAANNLADAFKFDPTTTGKPPEIPLGQLDVSVFGGSMKFFDANAGLGFDAQGSGGISLAITLGMQRTFEVQKPENPNRIIIFDRDQVDEIPVWLYGPQPRIPTQYDRIDWSVLVLYAVSERGKPENIYVLDSSDPALAVPVKEAIAEWRFRPARKGGRAVKIWVQQPVNYHAGFKSPFSL